MKKTLFIFFCISLSVAVFALGKSDMRAFRELCGKAGISEDYVSLEPDHNRNGGFGCFSDFYRLWDDWTLISPYGISLSENIFSSKKSAAKFTETISERADSPIDMDFAKSEIKQIDVCLKDKNCFRDALKSVNGAYLVGNESQIPEKSKKYIAGLLYSAEKVASYRKDIYKSDVYEKLFRALHTCGNDIDRKKLATGAYVLSHYTDIACNKLREEGGSFYVAVQTDLGCVEISSGQDNVYKMTDSFLVIDFSGNDTYGAGYGGCDFKKPVSVIIDLKGNDRYITDKSSSFGAGVMGWGFLADLEGDDEYFADSFSMGAGYGGVGILLDYKGNDKYSGNICVQGSSANGIGYLRDFEGNDTYYAYEYAQGFGGPGGVGVLADDKGNDVYTAEDKDIVNPSPQTADHNTSMSQGAGFGYRNENIAGGIGMLADREGDDIYSCGVFGQGISYWYSLGFLIDSKGNDTHNAVWYCYGAAAHYSV
ncbi:MAG: hypothetical protein KBT47_02955, partial [Armatimonadetes bacterium]|nr:hypothetical protein [Candidatus Hippobium faecium]